MDKMDKQEERELNERQPYRHSEATKAKISAAMKGNKSALGHTYKPTPETIVKLCAAQKGHPTTCWKGGVIEHNGYRMVWEPNHPESNKNGYVYQHRLVMEEELGRYLEPGETIHHLNEDKLDNRISNLLLFNSDREHQIYEAPSRTRGIDGRFIAIA